MACFTPTILVAGTGALSTDSGLLALEGEPAPSRHSVVGRWSHSRTPRRTTYVEREMPVRVGGPSSGWRAMQNIAGVLPDPV